MKKDEYIAEFELIGETITDENISEIILNKLANRAIELEHDIDFTLDEIYEELEEVTPKSYQKLDWYSDFLEEVANFIFDKIEDSQEEDPIDEE